MKNLLRAGIFTLLSLSLSACIMLPSDEPAASSTAAGGDGAGGTTWDAGNIISDQVFYNANALGSEAAVQAELDKIGGSCTSPTCLRNDTYSTASASSQWCTPYFGGAAEKYAAILYKLAQACGINPQVAIVMIQKESQGLSKEQPPAALTGFGCPDTGPGGSANCSASSAGVWQQTYGMFSSFARLRKDASRVNYLEGQTHQILWNVAETGCGSAPVLVTNRATATLYTYTPYQPNKASLDAYPGEGDTCSSYGNRNFFRLFQKYFGPTGGGNTTGTVPGGAVLADGVKVIIPDNEFVDAAVRGKTITTANNGIAKGIGAGFGALGLPYVWGGGGDGGGPNNGCERGGGQYNSCGSESGFDCSGLTAYVLVQGGFPSPGGSSGEQRNSSHGVAWDQRLPGDIIGFPGHVAVYLGDIDGKVYILEASWVGTPVHIVPLTRTDRDGAVYRYWNTGSVA